MKATLHNVQLSVKRESREVVIIEGCEECVAAFHMKLAALIAEAIEMSRTKPCGCKEVNDVSDDI